jgi:hypothetical protein
LQEICDRAGCLRDIFHDADLYLTVQVIPLVFARKRAEIPPSYIARIQRASREGG